MLFDDLIAFGFDAEAVKRALAVCNQDGDAALEHLLRPTVADDLVPIVVPVAAMTTNVTKVVLESSSLSETNKILERCAPSAPAFAAVREPETPTPIGTQAADYLTLPWRIRPRRFPKGRLYSVDAPEDSTVSKESEEFNKGAAQFARFGLGRIDAVTRVDVIEYDVDSPVLQQYLACRAEQASKLGVVREITVFHGTPKDFTVELIVETGFKVGGVDAGVPRINGAAYGPGVYTAIGAALPQGYSRGTGCVVLARGLLGLENSDQAAILDTVRPGGSFGDVCVFRRGRQLLPCYVVYYEDKPITTYYGNSAAPAPFNHGPKTTKKR